MNKQFEALMVQLQAGKIKRWHTHPIIGEQTVADHTYGVVQILRYLYQNKCPPCLLTAALDHDVPEWYTGDIPFGAKEGSHSLRMGLRKLEACYIEDGGIIHDLTIAEKKVLKFADLAEMGFFAMHQWKMGNDTMEVVINVIDALPEINLSITEKSAAIIKSLLMGFVNGQGKR